MPELTNRRWERSCHALLEGKTADQAYVDAGYKRNNGNAIRLKGNEQVAARIDELKAEAAKVAVLDKAWELIELRRTYEMSIGERKIGNRDDADYGFSPTTAKGILELIGKDRDMFEDKVKVDQTVRERSPEAKDHNLSVPEKLPTGRA